MHTRRNKHSLSDAIALVDEAVAIADSYRCDNAFTPDSKDFERFESLREALWSSHCMLEHIIRGLQGRKSKWDNAESMAYHLSELR